MRASWILAVLVGVIGLAVVGCGDSSSGGDGGGGSGGTFDWNDGGSRPPPVTSCKADSKPQSVKGSCNISLFCMEFTGSSYTDQAAGEMGCNMAGGTFSTSPCDKTNAVGGCMTDCGTNLETVAWFEEIDFFDPKESCEEDGDTWLE